MGSTEYVDAVSAMHSTDEDDFVHTRFNASPSTHVAEHTQTCSTCREAEVRRGEGRFEDVRALPAEFL
jgi:hypothetical protein